MSLDVLAPQVAFSPGGIAAVGYGVQDVDSPADSTAFSASRSSAGRLSAPRQVPGAQQILGLAFDRSTLELLTGMSPAGLACCSSVGAIRMSRGSFGSTRTIVRGLAGATTGHLLSFSGRLLAAIATERGVWVAQTDGTGRFARVHRLTSADARPEALQATAAGGGGSVLAWTARDRSSSVPRKIFIASGTSHAAPGPAHVVATVPGGHRIDELALAAGTIAWVESWYDRRGSYHSQVEVADIARARQRRSLALAGTIASGLSFATDTRGDQLLAWKTCTLSGACTVREALRRSGGRFAGPARLGSIDGSDLPAAALAPSGEGLVGWIGQGHVNAADLRPGGSRFSGSHMVSATNFAADLALAFGPTGTALATWSQGTLAPDVMGAVFRTG